MILTSIRINVYIYFNLTNVILFCSIFKMLARTQRYDTSCTCGTAVFESVTSLFLSLESYRDKKPFWYLNAFITIRLWNSVTLKLFFRLPFLYEMGSVFNQSVSVFLSFYLRITQKFRFYVIQKHSHNRGFYCCQNSITVRCYCQTTLSVGKCKLWQ